MNVTVDGRQQVQAVYQQWTQSGQRVFCAAGEKLAAGDNMITSTATISQQTPGNLLAAASAGVDATATHLLANVQHMIWPYDDEERLIGEDVWEIDPSKRHIIELDPRTSSHRSKPSANSRH
jgi:hypothetical protein